jgi:hypothetical protein
VLARVDLAEDAVDDADPPVARLATCSSWVITARVSESCDSRSNSSSTLSAFWAP